MNIIQNNNRKEASIRVEVVRQEDLNAIEKKLVSQLAEMMSAILADKDDNLVCLFGMNLGQLSDILNMAMHMREQMQLQKEHRPAKEVLPPESEEK